MELNPIALNGDHLTFVALKMLLFWATTSVFPCTVSVFRPLFCLACPFKRAVSLQQKKKKIKHKQQLQKLVLGPAFHIKT